MNSNTAQFGLVIESPLTTPEAVNYRPTSWPPSRDWPVMIDADGKIISRYGDSIWRLDPWSKVAECLNFGDGRVTRTNPIDSTNADLLRQVTAWMIWAPMGVRKPGTLVRKFKILRPIFVLCSQNGIIASDLMSFPKVAEQIHTVVAPSSANYVLTLLHDFYERRESLGFVLLDRIGLKRLAAYLPNQEMRQTAYIPPRIWIYQVNRLRECLDDFLLHRTKIEACYKFCLDAYATNHGTLRKELSSSSKASRNPFSSTTKKYSKGAVSYLGSFKQTAIQFGIFELLSRWIDSVDKENEHITVRSLSNYFYLVSRVGLAYILNFSLMRIDEGMNLKSDCIVNEHDPSFGDMCVLHGATSKTTDDDDAHWPTSPSVKVAVEAMTCIVRMQTLSAKNYPKIRINDDEIQNPLLIQRCLDPWMAVNSNYIHLRLRKAEYGIEVVKRFSKLFEMEQLRITIADFEIAKLLTPTLNFEKFAVGKVWTLSWHQLRRTGAVNMQASGLISDSSLQYLLKHATRAMSLYYGQGYSRLRLNDVSRTLYVRTMYEVLGKEFAQLLSNRFISRKRPATPS